jgi:hypothetical protein
MMKRVCAVAAMLIAVACGGSKTPTTPTPAVTTPAPAPAPAPILHANMLAAPTGTTTCRTGLCVAFTTSISNGGPGCATNVQVIARWYGADGAVPLPNVPDIPMGAPGGLANLFFRVGDTAIISALGSFNDVRSAHTVYRFFATWTDVACR